MTDMFDDDFEFDTSEPLRRKEAHKQKRFIAACHAMNGLLSNPSVDWNGLAKCSVDAADALLAELEESEQ